MTADEAGLSVARMSETTGVSAHTLRYYERAELIRPVARNPGNHRRYSPADVEWVRFLLRLRETGMPVAQMRRYARLREEGSATTESRLRLLEAHREELREQIARLRAHERALAEKTTAYRAVLAAPSTHAGSDPEPSAETARRSPTERGTDR
ncbi:MerR family transcriptional regulator [Leucobacter weissii]|uniref:MerR family transcriptional regulator n=1 Tax=Leucobacter weissii TaxID=1983706 RepID=A0A939S797_9MICO|nr:MerR family transcriptional regulator [Leucobacter weissii]MBO1900761.1 MerR family transcriptional regulator [Leucobacter weissii]